MFRETVFQMLFVDFHLPGTDAPSFCRWVRNQADGDMPVILVIVKESTVFRRITTVVYR